MNEKTHSDSSLLTSNIGTLLRIGFASLALISAGYKMGSRQSRKMLRKCNSEYRRLAKWERKLLKTQKRLEKERLGATTTKRSRRDF